MRLALRLSYFGDGFFGSQMQPGLRTVEGEFIAACRRLDLFTDWREAGYSMAGRTDRGVHARCQVCSFSTGEPDRAIRALNRVLPGDIWCTAWADVPAGFHPRYDAVSRTYRYYFFPAPGDTTLMHEAAERFVGRHDFSAFARAGDRNPEREVLSARVFESGRFAVFEVTGASFLWNMVRGMATALDRVGRGEMDPEEIARLLTDPPVQRLPAAPPEGLVLQDIDYGISFTPLPTDEKDRGYRASRRYNYHTIMAEVAALLAPEDEKLHG
ncbi:MAG: tRNA pseudouridine(38-40) synthase TruA [Methanomicrobiales archaeon]|nr:tRNA pseudouridine(38-40) synthase TruA [Methanomicrobiales archaeon]